MASSVTVTINARDNTRAGVRSLRRDIDNLRRQLPPDHTIYVNLNDRDALTRSGRLRRNLRNLGDDVHVRVTTTGPDQRDSNRLTRRLQRSLTAPFRIAGRTLGGIMSDGLGQGIIQAFQAAGPVGMLVLAGIIAGALSMIGAALSGLLVAAFGLAFVGLAGWSASTSKQVQAQWKSTATSLRENFKTIGEPMIPVLTRAIKMLEGMGDKIAPIFRQAMEEAVPATNGFIDKLFEGVKRMGKAMFDPIMDAWNVFAPIFGDVLADSMEMFGESFADMANLVKNNSVEIEYALRAVFWIIDKLIDTVTFFGKMWVLALGGVGDAIGGLMQFAINPLVHGALEAFGLILAGADNAFGWIPGIGDDLGRAREAFYRFKDDTVASLDAMAQKAYGWDEAMSKANRKRVLEADISKLQTKLGQARADLKKTSNQKARAKVEANINDLEAKLRRARGQLNNLNGQVARTYVYTTYTDIHTSLKTRKRRHGLRTGGVVGAAASGGVRNNQTLVGEDGPEIVDLPFGSRVRSNPDTRRQLRMPGSAGGGDMTLTLKSGPTDLDRLLLHILRRAIRAEGGDVQVVLGR